MAVIKCKMCGGDISLSPDKTYGTCEYCGTQMTLPRIYKCVMTKLKEL